MEKGYGNLKNKEFLTLSKTKSNNLYINQLVKDILVLSKESFDRSSLDALRNQTRFVELTYPLNYVETSDEEKEFLRAVILKDIYSIVKSEVKDYDKKIRYKTIVTILEKTESLWREIAMVYGGYLNDLYKPILLPDHLNDELINKLRKDIVTNQSEESYRYFLNSARNVTEIRSILRFKGIDPDKFLK